MQVNIQSLKGHNCFNEVFQTGKKFYAKNLFSVVLYHTKLPSAPIIHYGVTISKRLEKKAAVRNRIKRLLRESIRLLIKELKPSSLLNIDRIIFAYQKKLDPTKQITLNEVMPAVRHILEQANLFIIKKNKNENPN